MTGPGHDFGRTPMGHEQVCDRELAGRVATEATASPTVCICDEELLALEVCDIRCPTHGLVAFLTPLAAREST